jgi:hypothetical protein
MRLNQEPSMRTDLVSREVVPSPSSTASTTLAEPQSELSLLLAEARAHVARQRKLEEEAALARHRAIADLD